jgi:hypothetical protein
MFAETLQRAHDTAAATERERDKKRKRPKHYTGNSVRSKQRWAAKRNNMANAGHQLITGFFSKAKKMTRHLQTSQKSCQILQRMKSFQQRLK